MSKLKAVTIILLFSVILLLPAGSALADAGVVWRAEYFDNPSLKGSPVQVVQEAAIDHDWGYNAPLPGLPADKFSARWTTTADFQEGQYTFTVTVDDGATLWIDGKQIIDAWKVQAVTAYTGGVTLSAGRHEIRLNYFENTQAAVVKLWWRRDGDKPPTPPPSQPGPNPGPRPVERLVIDNDSPGFTWGGPGKYRHTAHGGHGGDFYWTYNNTTEPTNYGQWTPHFAQGGRYEVLVFIPGSHATSGRVRYRIMINGVRHDQIVDQAWYSDEWVSLGYYDFSGKNQGKEYIVAYDNTREALNSTLIAFDAVTLVPQGRR